VLLLTVMAFFLTPLCGQTEVPVSPVIPTDPLSETLSEADLRSALRAAELLDVTAIDWPKSSYSNGLPGTEAREAGRPVLTTMTGAPDATSKVSALTGLGDHGDESDVKPAVAAVFSPDPAVRQAAVECLATLEPGMVARRLLEAFSQRWPTQKELLKDIMPGLPGACQKWFEEVLTSQGHPPVQRAVAAFCLGASQDTKAAGALAAVAEESHDPVLAPACATALADMAHASCVPYMIGLLDHPLDDVRVAAIEGLGLTATPEAVDAVAAVARDKDGQTQGAAACAVTALGRIPNERAIPALIDAARLNSRVREQAIEVLRKKVGEDLGEDPEEWQAWYDQTRQGYSGPPPLVPYDSWPPPWLDPAYDPME